MRSLSVILIALAALVGMCCANYGYYPYYAGAAKSGGISTSYLGIFFLIFLLLIISRNSLINTGTTIVNTSSGTPIVIG